MQGCFKAAVTRDFAYWRQPLRLKTAETAGRCQWVRRAAGGLDWAEQTYGMIKGRQEPVRVGGSNEHQWQPYVVIDDAPRAVPLPHR